MIINEKNKERIEEMIRKAEGKASARTIDYRDIVNDIARIEKTLGIPKKDMFGIVADVDHHAQDFPNAYKFRAESTHYLIVRKSSGWDLVSVERMYTRKAGRRVKLDLTDESCIAILDKYRNF